MGDYSENLIEVRDLKYSRGPRPIFENLNLTIKRGEITALMGPSGTGKTTLLRLITRQLIPEQGAIYIDGVDIASLGIEHDAVNAAFPLIVQITGSTPAPPGVTFYRGEANNDNNIDLVDAIRIFTFLFRGGVEITCEDAADSNDSGGIDLVDGVFVLNWLFRGGDDLPDPAPTVCGVDPTEDELNCVSFPACS